MIYWSDFSSLLWLNFKLKHWQLVLVEPSSSSNYCTNIKSGTQASQWIMQNVIRVASAETWEYMVRIKPWRALIAVLVFFEITNFHFKFLPRSRMDVLSDAVLRFHRPSCLLIVRRRFWWIIAHECGLVTWYIEQPQGFLSGEAFCTRVSRISTSKSRKHQKWGCVDRREAFCSLWFKILLLNGSALELHEPEIENWKAVVAWGARDWIQQLRILHEGWLWPWVSIFSTPHRRRIHSHSTNARAEREIN